MKHSIGTATGRDNTSVASSESDKPGVAGKGKEEYPKKLAYEQILNSLPEMPCSCDKSQLSVWTNGVTIYMRVIDGQTEEKHAYVLLVALNAVKSLVETMTGESMKEGIMEHPDGYLRGDITPEQLYDEVIGQLDPAYHGGSNFLTKVQKG